MSPKVNAVYLLLILVNDNEYRPGWTGYETFTL